MKIRVLRILVPPLELILRLGESRYSVFRRVLTGAPPGLLAVLGSWRAVHAADSARRHVPAYGRFLAEHATSGVAIDESSGSTGTPYNWIRSRREREAIETSVSHFTRYLYGAGVLVTINAFSMGAWATGPSMGIAMFALAMLKFHKRLT